MMKESDYKRIGISKADFKLFAYYFKYKKTNITWTRIKAFCEEYSIELTKEQKLNIHQYSFSN